MTPDQIPDPHPDDDVRAMLHRQAESVQPADGYPGIQRKLAEAPTGHRLWGANPALVAVAAVLALLVGAGVVAIAIRGDDDQGVRTTDQPSETTAPPATTTSVAPPTTPTVPATEAPTTIVSVEPQPTTIAPTTAAPTTTTTVPEPITTPITDASTVAVNGIGPIILPISRADFEDRTGQKLTPPSGDFPGSPCDFTRIVGGPDNVVFMTDGDRLVRLDSNSSEMGLAPIRTDVGIGFGSTRAQVFAAYPGAKDNVSVYGQPEIIVTDTARPGYKLNFGLSDGTVSSLSAGISEFVDYPEGCA